MNDTTDNPRDDGAFAEVTPIPAIRSLDALTYRVPAPELGSLEAGMRVLVPVGRRKVTAIVTSASVEPPADVECKDIEEVLDREPIVTADLLRLARWMADYYASPLADVLSLAVGKGLTAATKRVATLADPQAFKLGREIEAAILARLEQTEGTAEVDRIVRDVGKTAAATLNTLAGRGAISITHELERPNVKEKTQAIVRVLRMPEEQEAADLFKRSPRRREVFEFLAERPGRTASMRELSEICGSPGTIVSALEEAGLVERDTSEVYRGGDFNAEEGVPVELNEEQQAAFGALKDGLGKFGTFLLQGVTASGKTEVYLRIINEVLDRGGNALVLVPEISLTHQVVARLIGRFGQTVAVLHSELSPGEKWDQWRRICRGEARIVVGARSAVLAPLARTEIVIVDEEHDPAYKQEDGVRYHGRDVAVVRAHQAGCPVVLGSATPSIETWNNAVKGRYSHLILTKRVASRPLPQVEVVDLRGRDIVARGGLSEHLEEQLRKNYEAGDQSLVFLNRRGFASSLMCYECGDLVECRNCSVAMTLHRDRARLACHHCDDARPIPDSCPTCFADALVSQGIGTQRLETTLRELLPEARIGRLDRDTASKKGETGRVMAAWRAGEFDLLIGTQMITKGHDAQGVTLVGVIQADMALSVPDFRASERTFQLLTQVAGRAGRGEKRGRVILQTYRPDHPAIAAAVRQDFDAFAEEEIAQREELGYPPFARLSMLRIEGRSEQMVHGAAQAAAASLAALAGKTEGRLIVRGPAPAPIERVKDRYRYQIQLRSEDANLVRHAARACRDNLSEKARKHGLRILVDIDAVDMS